MSGSRQEVSEKVIEVTAELLGMSESDISEESKLEDDLRADSLTLAELILKIEETFELPDITEEEADKIKTVGDVIEYVAKKLDVF